MFAAKQNQYRRSPDATGLPRGDSRLQLLASNVKPPRPKAVASSYGLKIGVANDREVPQDKSVASFRLSKPCGKETALPGKAAAEP